MYCRSIKEATDYCSYDKANNKCILAINADCAAITIPTTGSWDSENTASSDTFKSAYCLAQSYKDRTKFCKYTSGTSPTKCSDAACTDIPSPTS